MALVINNRTKVQNKDESESEIDSDSDTELKQEAEVKESLSEQDDIKSGSEMGYDEDDEKDIFDQLDDQTIKRPKTDKEKELMSLVFGAKAELVSNLADDCVESGAEGRNKRQRSAAWHDTDDENDEDYPDKALKSEPKATVRRRRKQYEKIVGQPKWADLDREKEVDSDDEILRTVGHVVEGTVSDLPKENIELKKLKNLNRETKHEGEITAINFHPTSMVAIMAGTNGFASIVAVDGTKNEKLHTIGLQKFKIACCRLTPDGNEVIFGSFRKFYHVYNLISGQSDTLQLSGEGPWTMKMFDLSKCGKYLAVGGSFGEIYLLDARSKDIITTIQQRHHCSSICFSPDSKYLFAHSNDTDVSVYHLEKRRFVNVFTDEGCVNGSFVAVCPNNRFLATGNRQGVVNVYRVDKVLKEKYPSPEKTISNLTTSIGSIVFNATSELLAIASPDIPNAVRLVHLKSGTVFRNFPMMKANLGNVTQLQFSPGSGFLAIGNRQGVVSLFRIKHYQNY
ncbi:U3 small nucleolar RNA-associated protein 18 homolog [Toxorhynchites rutilus septentrionalis]|uniref:U3 small nucleolar RNA-associated protein 18 homolog n=1 Tax=Toxorhynchites rutilus septentrionalis TaxID=329112 RepID=UPI002478F80D|nr:U3 small nucleolar RNA-associated protein 18 homolog [Toxorhynchites rutilus septentrionalis]